MQCLDQPCVAPHQRAPVPRTCITTAVSVSLSPPQTAGVITFKENKENSDLDIRLSFGRYLAKCREGEEYAACLCQERGIPEGPAGPLGWKNPGAVPRKTTPEQLGPKQSCK